jgi:probable rRNA maturation factor
MDELGVGHRELTVVLCDDKSMQRQNLAFLGDDHPTDVLSFPLWEPQDNGFPYIDHLGDIMIGIDIAKRQANANWNTVDEEILVLAAHGLMHLLGHDHPSEDGWKPFHAAQTRIIALARLDVH